MARPKFESDPAVHHSTIARDLQPCDKAMRQAETSNHTSPPLSRPVARPPTALTATQTALPPPSGIPPLRAHYNGAQKLLTLITAVKTVHRLLDAAKTGDVRTAVKAALPSPDAPRVTAAVFEETAAALAVLATQLRDADG